MRSLFLTTAFGAALVAGPVMAQPSAEQRAVETGLQPAAVFDGKAEGWTVEQRMARWKVPGVSVAVVDDGRIAWARGYGVIAAGQRTTVTPETRFQAASVSKPVAAAAAMSLVQDGRLTLDGDVNASLKSWTLPASAFTAERPLTLKDLLSHTGGTTVHGFPGYAQGAAVPTLVQLLNGAAPANTKAVVSEAKPGERWKYSGGGYEIVQQMIEDASGRPFADVVQARVLAPIGMTASGYALPPKGAFALAHGLDGKPIRGGWRSYPEAAAAGLWTTPSDLARFGLALTAAYRGEAGGPLAPATVKTMLTPVMGGYGLGPGVSGEGEALAVSHGGSNEGFRAFWVIHPVTGDGVAVMTNGESGDRVMMEIVRAVAKTYGWPDFAPATYASFTLAPDVLAAREGDWAVDLDGQHIVFTLRRDGQGLAIETFRGTYPFTPITATTMVAPEIGAKASFETGADGKPVLKVFGLTLKKGG